VSKPKPTHVKRLFVRPPHATKELDGQNLVFVEKEDIEEECSPC